LNSYCFRIMAVNSGVALQEFINGNNSFAAAVYEQIVKYSEGNFLVSPLSAETILAFAQSGCKDETAQEIRNVLYLSDDKNKIETGIKHFLHNMRSGKNDVLHNAIKMYIKENFSIKDEFKRAATEVYGADLENINFSKKVEAAATMNKWFEKETNNKIHDPINSDGIKDETRTILLNALYFKADWLHKFALVDTEKAYFYKTARDAVEVDTMRYHSDYQCDFNYHESKELKAKFLELPFEGEDASMVVILPHEKEGLGALESQIGSVFAPRDFRKRLVNVALPKFKIESGIDFKRILQNLGVNKAFDKDEADLSGIAGGKGDLIIDQVVQKTLIEVSEEGVEAAAAAFARIPIPACYVTIPPANFTADHPFIFYVKVRGAITFAGRVTDPEQ
ncbi:Serpin domain containing protein, partial [Asbolus verrucosus]